MYYGEGWLNNKIKEAKKIKIKKDFRLNDLYLLISFRQIVPHVNSIKEIDSLNLSYNLGDASTIPLLTNYLVWSGNLFQNLHQNKEYNINLIDKSISKLEEMGLIDYLDPDDKWALPREKADFINFEGKYVIQAVKNFEKYKSKNIPDRLFFDYQSFIEES